MKEGEKWKVVGEKREYVQRAIHIFIWRWPYLTV